MAVYILCMQAGEDGTRLAALQEQVTSLTQQVQQLLPLQPKLSTAEVERDTALHRLERLQVCMADAVLVSRVKPSLGSKPWSCTVPGQKCHASNHNCQPRAPAVD